MDNPLPSSIQTKGLVVSGNNEIMVFSLNQSMRSIDVLDEATVETFDLKCKGSREEFLCSALGYLCNSSAFFN